MVARAMRRSDGIEPGRVIGAAEATDTGIFSPPLPIQRH